MRYCGHGYMLIGNFAGIDKYMYSWNKGIHGIFVNPTKNYAATWIVDKLFPNNNLC